MGIRLGIIKFAGYLFCTSVLFVSSNLRVFAEELSQAERIDATNWKEYSEYLLEPLAGYLDSSDLAFFYDANSKRRFARVRENTSGTPDQNSGLKIFLDSQARIEHLQGFIGFYRVLLYPRYAARTTSSAMPPPHSDTRVSEIIVGAKKIEQRSAEEDSIKITPEIFRFVRFISPASVRSLTHLYKSKMSDNKLLEENKKFSPVFSNCRKVHAENRTDDILHMPLSFEDIHFFSTASNSAEYTLVTSKELFIPVGRMQQREWKDFSTLVSHQICSAETFADGSQVTFEQAPIYRNSYGQQKKSYIVEKEKLHIIKESSTSPLSEGAYSYYFIGSDTLLPYYKIEYDFNREPRRLVVAHWAERPDSNDKNPLLASLQSYDLTSEAAAFLELRAYTNEVGVDCFEEFYESVCPTS